MEIKKRKMIRNTTSIVILLVMVFSMGSCSKDGHIFIKLSEKHLEETPAGFWLSMFEIDYSPGAERMKKQVMDKLKSDGILLEEYARENGANKVFTRIWKYKGTSFKEMGSSLLLTHIR